MTISSEAMCSAICCFCSPIQLNKTLILIPLFDIFAEGQHTLTKTIVTSKVSKLAMFTKKRETCLGCKAVLDNSEYTV